MARHLTRFTLAPAVFVGALVLTSCGGAASTAASDEAANDGVTTVVASTSVYGDLAQTIGGDEIEVSSIVSTTAQDPHSYEATAQDKLAVTKADLVIGNGGGYDFFLEQLVGGLDLSEGSVLYAVDYFEGAHDDEHGDESGDEHSGDGHSDEEHADGEHEDGGHSGGDHEDEDAGEHDDHGHTEMNEHVWYDLHTVSALAHEITEQLSALDPENSTLFEERYESLAADLDGLAQRQEALSGSGEAYAMTEPVPFYLLEEAGLENVTPDGYSEAIEHGEDVAPLIQKELVDTLESGDAAVLAYNPQTESPQTEAARQAAEGAGVAVVEFTETLPEGEDYAGWMSANISALEEALDR